MANIKISQLPEQAAGDLTPEDVIPIVDIGSTATRKVSLDSLSTYFGVGVFPGAGVPVSTGATWGTSKAVPTGTIVGDSDTQTLTNKTVSGINNTLTNISLTSAVTGALPVANGGTGAADAATARTNLGLGTAATANTTAFATAAQGAKADTALQPAAIGVSVQAYDADLTSWAAIAPSAKQDTLVSGTNIKTVNGNSLLGSGDLTISGGSSTLTISNKTAAYTVVAGDNGTIINCTANTFTVSLTAAATLGAGFNCWVWNTSSTSTHVITIDPSGTETIDGISSLALSIGEGTQIICDGINWQTGNKKTMRGYSENMHPGVSRPTASGYGSLALLGGYASGQYGIAIGAAEATAANSLAIAASPGTNAKASGDRSIAIGEGTAASAAYTTAVGFKSGGGGAKAVTGSGAMALGGSYASGTDSFAAAVANNTSSYGATGANSVAIGYVSTATASKALALGYNTRASAVGSTAIGSGETSGIYASASYSTAIGDGANTQIVGKFGYSSAGRFSANGDAQYGLFVLRRATTDATAAVLTSDNAASAATNQVILPNNSAYAFTGTIIARQQAAGGSNYAAWEIKGAIIRDATAASTSLGSYNINVLSKTAGASAWTVALSADTTNGGLAITVTGAAATNIRWVATVQTSEVTYA